MPRRFRTMASGSGHRFGSATALASSSDAEMFADPGTGLQRERGLIVLRSFLVAWIAHSEGQQGTSRALGQAAP